jgi:predicted O-methyltransferase YrrM
MASTLQSAAVVQVLDRLHATAESEDAAAALRVRESETRAGARLPQTERYKLYGDAPLAIKRDVGRLLYVLVRTRRPRRVVEFGASHGVSAVYLAAAIRDSGSDGSLITTEQRASKTKMAERNIADAGLADLVDLRTGDALRTLADVAGAIDVLFLDGRNDLYLSVLQLVETRLAPDALVIADLSADDPDLLPYLNYVCDRERYVSVTVPLDAGVVVSVPIRHDPHTLRVR